MPGVRPQLSSTTSAGTGVDVDSTISAASPVGPRAEVELLDVDAVRRRGACRRCPIIPGVSSLRTTSMWLDGGDVDDVVVDGDDARRVLLAVERARDVRAPLGGVPAELDEVHVVARRRRRRLAHRRAHARSASCGAFTNDTGSSMTGSSTPFRIASVSTRQS